MVKVLYTALYFILVSLFPVDYTLASFVTAFEKCVISCVFVAWPYSIYQLFVRL